MATEYDLFGSTEVSTDELRAFVVRSVGGTAQPNGAVLTDGLLADAYRIEPGDEMSATGYFGFEHHVTITFRLLNNVTANEADAALQTMVEAVIAFFDTYPGSGVLLFNGEEVVLQRLSNEVEVSSSWDAPEVHALLSGYPFHRLPQPLL